MEKAWIKLENIPTNDEQVFDEIWIPIHEIYSIARIKNELLIAFIGIKNVDERRPAIFSYRCETEEIAQKTISNIFDKSLE